MSQYNDSILFEAFRLIKQIFRILIYAILIFGIALCNDFGWIVGLGCNGYWSRTMSYKQYVASYEKYIASSSQTGTGASWTDINVNFASGEVVGKGEWRNYEIDRSITGYGGRVTIDMHLCNTPFDVGHNYDSFDSLLDSNFYTRSHHSLYRKIAKINRAIVTASVATFRLREVIARLKEGKAAGINDDDSHYCGGADWSHYIVNAPEYRLTDPVAAQVKLNHAPKVVLGPGTACLSSYQGLCIHQPSFYKDLFAVTLSPEQEEAEAAMLQMGTEDFWLTAAHENGVYKDSEIRASVAALHRILNERHPQFDEGGVRETTNVTFLQIIGLQNFEDNYSYND